MRNPRDSRSATTLDRVRNFGDAPPVCEEVVARDDDISDDLPRGGHSIKRVCFSTLDIQLEEIDALEPELRA